MASAAMSLAELTVPEFEKSVRECLDSLIDQNGALSVGAMEWYARLMAYSRQSRCLRSFLAALAHENLANPGTAEQLVWTGFLLGWQARETVERTRERAI